MLITYPTPPVLFLYSLQLSLMMNPSKMALIDLLLQQLAVGQFTLYEASNITSFDIKLIKSKFKKILDKDSDFDDDNVKRFKYSLKY